MKKLILTLAILLLLPAYTSGQQEFPEDFRYKGIPIDPDCILDSSGRMDSSDYESKFVEEEKISLEDYLPLEKCMNIGRNLGREYFLDKDGKYGFKDEFQQQSYYNYLGKTENDIHVIKHFHNIGWREFTHIVFVHLISKPSPRIKILTWIWDWSEREVIVSNNTVRMKGEVGDNIYRILSIDLNAWKNQIVFTPHNIKQGMYTYAGNINGANVEAQLEFEGKYISGHYSYNRYKKSIKLQGLINGILEFSIDESFKGRNTGNFSGKYISKDMLSGVWSDPAKKKSIPFKLIRTKTKEEMILCKYVKSIPAIKNERLIPDKNILLSVNDNEVKIKNLNSGKVNVLAKLENLSYEGTMGYPEYGLLKNKVSISKDGSIAAVGGDSSTDVVAWDTDNWTKIFEGGGGTFDLSPNGRYLAIAGHGWKGGWELVVFKNKEGNVKFEGSNETPLYEGEEFFFSKDSKFLIVDSGHGFYQFYDIQKNSNIKVPCN